MYFKITVLKNCKAWILLDKGNLIFASRSRFLKSRYRVMIVPRNSSREPSQHGMLE